MPPGSLSSRCKIGVCGRTKQIIESKQFLLVFAHSLVVAYPTCQWVLTFGLGDGAQTQAPDSDARGLKIWSHDRVPFGEQLSGGFAMHVRRGNFASLVVTIFLPLLLLSLAAMPLFAQSTSTGTLAGSVT